MGVTSEEDKKSLDVGEQLTNEVKAIDFILTQGAYIPQHHLKTLNEMVRIRKVALELEARKV